MCYSAFGCSGMSNVCVLCVLNALRKKKARAPWHRWMVWIASHPHLDEWMVFCNFLRRRRRPILGFCVKDSNRRKHPNETHTEITVRQIRWMDNPLRETTITTGQTTSGVCGLNPERLTKTHLLDYVNWNTQSHLVLLLLRRDFTGLKWCTFISQMEWRSEQEWVCASVWAREKKTRLHS